MFSSWKGLDEQTRLSVKFISAVVVLVVVFFLSVHTTRRVAPGRCWKMPGGRFTVCSGL